MMKTAKILFFTALINVYLITSAFSQFTPNPEDTTKRGKNYWGSGSKSDRPVEYVPAPTGSNPQNIKRRPVNQPDVSLNDSKITFEYTIFDFGNVAQNTNVTHLFKVSNTGTDTLHITHIKPT